MQLLLPPGDHVHHEFQLVLDLRTVHSSMRGTCKHTLERHQENAEPSRRCTWLSADLPKVTSTRGWSHHPRLVQRNKHSFVIFTLSRSSQESQNKVTRSRDLAALVLGSPRCWWICGHFQEWSISRFRSRSPPTHGPTSGDILSWNVCWTTHLPVNELCHQLQTWGPLMTPSSLDWSWLVCWERIKIRNQHLFRTTGSWIHEDSPTARAGSSASPWCFAS